MKLELQKIKDVKVGQIYKDKGGFIIIKRIDETCDGVLGFLVNWNNGNNVNSNSSTTEFLGFDISKNKDYKLIGFLNITHKIENNKLIEIKREEFEVGDIFEYEFKDKSLALYGVFRNFTITIDDIKFIELIDKNGFEHHFRFDELNIKKIGIYGVTHEFKLVNE